MSGDPVVIDSSVAAKWFLDGEPDFEAAWTLLRRHRDEEIELHAPTLLRLEVLNAAWARRLDEDRLREVAETLDGLRMRLVEPDAELLSDAAGIAARHRLTVYDATFVALAARLDCELVTADRRLASQDACRVRLLGE